MKKWLFLFIGLLILTPSFSHGEWGGTKIGNLSDVDHTTEPATDNYILKYNASTQLWTYESDGTVDADLEMGNTPYSIDGGTNGLAFDPDNDTTNEVTIDTDGDIDCGSLRVDAAVGGAFSEIGLKNGATYYFYCRQDGFHIMDDFPLGIGDTGGSSDSYLLFETADANACATIFSLQESSSSSVPVLVIGDKTNLNKDLGFFNGITEPRVGICDDAATSAVTLGFGDNDSAVPEVAFYGSATELTIDGDLEARDKTDLASESLANGTDFSQATWTLGSEFAVDGTSAKYTFAATGTGTITQTSGNMTIAGVGSRWYKFQYVISASTVNAGAALTITNAFGSAAVTLPIIATTNTVYFKSTASPGNFVVSISGATTGSLTITSMTLKEITGGDMIVDGIITGGGTTGIKVMANGNVGIGDTTAPSSIVDIEDSGTAKGNINLLELTNTKNAADMDGTTSSILFNQWYYDASTPAVADSGNIAVGTEQDWSSTNTTQDSYLAFSTSLNGTVSEKARIDSNGYLGIACTPATALDVDGVGTFRFDDLAYTTITQADGAGVTFDSVSDGTAGFTFNDSITVIDNAKVNVGTGADGQFYSSSDNVYIDNVTSNKDIIFRVLVGAAQTEVGRFVGATGAVDFGSATSTEIVSAANPTIDAAGEIGIVTGANALSGIRYYGDAARFIPAYQVKSFHITNPTATDDFLIAKMPYTITIREIHGVCHDGTSIAIVLNECDSNGDNPVAICNSATVTTSDTTATITNASVDAGDYMSYTCSNNTGSVTKALVTIYYTVD